VEVQNLLQRQILNQLGQIRNPSKQAGQEEVDCTSLEQFHKKATHI
jgi:hypothetical protein